MADNLSVTTANGNATVATADRAGVHFQRFLPAAGGAGSHGAYTVTSTPTAHVGASSTRRYIILQNQGTVNVHYGYTTAIGPGQSNYIAPGDSLTCEVTSAIYLATPDVNATVTFDQVTN